MPITCDLKNRTVIKGESCEEEWLIFGTDSHELAVIALEEASEDTYETLPRQPVEVADEFVDADNPDRCILKGQVRYRAANAAGGFSTPQTGDSTFSFDIGSETAHTIVDKDGNLIGWDGQQCNGVDVDESVYVWSETHYLPAAVVTEAYKGTLFRLRGCVSPAPFKGSESGECRFLGASGSQRGQYGDWEITFRFGSKPNRLNFMVGDVNVASANGWEYLDVEYEDQEDEETGRLIAKPVKAEPRRLYSWGDFSLLGIGT